MENFNTEIGVPHTLFGLDRSHQAAVLEMAMRGPGQIKRLCEIARPSIGVVTNIGLSHIEFLGSRDGIALAKAELLRFLDADGVAVINADDEYADFLAERCQCRVIAYGIEGNADFRSTNITYSSEGDTRFKVNGVQGSVRASGKHHALNAATACAVASLFDISLEQTAHQLASFAPPKKRGEWFEMLNGAIFVDDTYNAAPDSTRSALQTLSVLAEARGKQRKVAVLGDMKELEEFSSEAHNHAGKMVQEEGIQMLITVGEAAQEIASAATHLPQSLKHNFPTSSEAAKAIMSLILPEDIVFVKGARAMRMEQIIQVVDPGPNVSKRNR